MSRHRFRRFHATVAAVIALLVIAPPASAQDLPGCTPRALPQPARTVYECAGGLTIDAEAAARLGLATRPGDGDAQAIDMDTGAALFDFKSGGRPLQIRTPHAIASVRGTVYAVDVRPESTSVLVVEGIVRVTRRSGRSGVTLTAGRGIVVAAGRRLVSQRWDKARTDALLSRLGR